MKKRWKLLVADENKVKDLQESLQVSPTLCRLLVNRGIETYEQAYHFFRPSLENLHSPWLMKDMQKAVDRILRARENNEKVLLFGDYDVDGTTAVSIFYLFLKEIHPNIEFYIPHRYREGYGISKIGIDLAYEQGFSLIISLDCGIKSVDLIRYAGELGIDFVVCDHHLPDKELPPAVAILNPKQSDCNYPYKELCGCGVGFKLMSALAETLGVAKDVLYRGLDLLATAIAADIVPMTGENRILAYHGLERVNKEPNHGIRALTQLSSLKGKLTISNLVFMIAPRVNAAGRMDDARKAVQMFIAGSYDQAKHFAQQLHNDNSGRKEADSSITREALEMIRSNQGWEENKSTVVFQPHWHKGVVGIVASRLIEHYHRPTIVLTRSGEMLAGSARSVPGFNLYEAVHACRDHLLGYGGHFAAAGMTLEPEQLDAFRTRFEEVVSSTIDPNCLVPELVIDAELDFSQINNGFYNIIRQMEPFGPENPHPLFLAREVQNAGDCRVVKENHLRFSVTQNGKHFTGIGFGLSDCLPLLQGPVDLVFKLDENDWNGRKSLQLLVTDVQTS